MGSEINLITIFLTGLLTGGLTCMAVQGGLLTTTIAKRQEEKLRQKMTTSHNAIPILSFLGAKLVAYTILGALLGWFGSLFTLSITTQVILQIGVSIFMIGTALSILNVNPIFHYFVIQPPKFITRFIRKESKSSDAFAPATLGAFTVFIPCGTTQAMMALSVASGSPILGSLVLFIFVLGTSPVFFALGYFVTKLSDSFNTRFMKVAAYSIVLLALWNINNAVALSGSALTIENGLKGFWCTVSFCSDSKVSAQVNPVSSAKIILDDKGYFPSTITVKAGSPVTLDVVNENGNGCIQAFTIPQLGIQRIIPIGTSESIQFTAPQQKGELAFTCSMGMYRGIINVI